MINPVLLGIIATYQSPASKKETKSKEDNSFSRKIEAVQKAKATDNNPKGTKQEHIDVRK